MRTKLPLYSPQRSERLRSLRAFPGLRARALGLTLPLALALIGCSARYQWVKDGLSTSLADAKFASCQLEAERLSYSSVESDDDRAARVRHESHLCMKADGWRLTQIESAEPGDHASYASSAASMSVPPRSSEAPTVQAGESPSSKPSSKPEEKPTVKKEVKVEVQSAAAADDDEEDDS